MKKNIALILILILHFSCSIFIGYKSYYSSDRAIPIEFKENPNIIFLCELSGDKEHDNTFKETFSKHYLGEHLFIHKNELKEFSDLEKYRYVLTRQKREGYEQMSSGGFDRKYKVEMTYYMLIDRRTKEIYGTMIDEYRNYRHLIIAYAKALEEARSKT